MEEGLFCTRRIYGVVQGPRTPAELWFMGIGFVRVGADLTSLSVLSWVETSIMVAFVSILIFIPFTFFTIYFIFSSFLICNSMQF